MRFRISSVAGAAAGLLMAAQLASAAAPLPAEAFLPGAKVVMGIRVRGLLDGLKPVMPQGLSNQTAVLLSGTPLAGFDPFNDIDEVVISSTGEGAKPPSLVMVRGRIPLERLSKNSEVYKGLTLMKSGQQDFVAVALGDGTVLLGEAPLVKAAIDRRGDPSALDPDLTERMEALRNRYDFWAVGSIPEGTPLPKEADGLKSLDRFEFGAAVQHDFDVEVSAHFRSPDDLEKMAATLQFVQMMMKSQPDTQKAEFHVTNTEDTLRVSLHMAEADWKKALEDNRAAMQSVFENQMHLNGPKAMGTTTSTRRRPSAAMPRITVPQPVEPPMPVKQTSRSTASKDTRYVTAEDGSTVSVTLPGGH